MFDTPHDNMPTIEEYQKDIRAAEIRGATFMHNALMKYSGGAWTQDQWDAYVQQEATRIVDALSRTPGSTDALKEFGVRVGFAVRADPRTHVKDHVDRILGRAGSGGTT
jgi:hypothetical protein